MDNQNTGGRGKKGVPFGYSPKRNFAVLLTGPKKDSHHWRQTSVFRTHKLYKLTTDLLEGTAYSFAHSLDAIKQATNSLWRLLHSGN